MTDMAISKNLPSNELDLNDDLLSEVTSFDYLDDDSFTFDDDLEDLDFSTDYKLDGSVNYTPTADLILERAAKDKNLVFDSSFDAIEYDPFYSPFFNEAIKADDNKKSQKRSPKSTKSKASVASSKEAAREALAAANYFVNHCYSKDKALSIRSIMAEKLSGKARFVRLKSGTKEPVGKFDDANTSKVAPTNTDYGIVPKKNLFVLDIDAHPNSGTTPNEQIEMFSEFLGVNLRESLTVATPNGGYHVYLLIPEAKGQLPVGLQNLNCYQDAFSRILGRDVIVDSDIRTGKSAGYIVGPTSSVIKVSESEAAGKIIREFYKIADESYGFSPLAENADLLYISDVGFDRMAQLKDEKKIVVDEELAVRRAKRIEKRKKDALNIKVKNEILPISDKSLQLDSLPPSDLLRKLEKELASRSMVTFHQKRSFIKAALHCCHSDAAIAQVCIDFDIDRDSATQDKITQYDLMRDIERFNPSISFHGGYCANSQRQAKLSASNFISESTSFDLKKYREENAAKVANRTVSRHKPGYHSSVNPRVLDVGKISKSLLANSKRKTPSQQYFDAMLVADYFLQPLSNAGAKTLLLARKAIEDRLELSSSRASQALRILREKEIISVVDKQRTGLAATYSVDEIYTHPRLTKTLRMLWGFNGVPLETGEVDDAGNLKKFHANIYLDRHSGVFKEVFTDKTVESNFPLISSWINAMNESSVAESSPNVGPGAAVSYLKKEAKERGLTVVGGSETIIVEESTGEIVSQTSNPRNKNLNQNVTNKRCKTSAVFQDTSYVSTSISSNVPSFITKTNNSKNDGNYLKNSILKISESPP